MATDVTKFNEQTIEEEIGNAVVHCVGTCLAIAGCVLVIIRAAFYSDAMGVTAASLYGASMILLFLFSTLYHALQPYKAKRVFQVFDHCSIFLLILGTYIPVCFTMLRGPLGWVVFGINTGLAVLGIVANSVNLYYWANKSLILYVLMGWSIVLCARPVLTHTSIGGLMFLVGGGILYTAGVPFYVSRRKWFHFIWHFFVLGGAVLHWFFVFFSCYPAK